MGLLENKVALVTGGASGIGRGTALRFAQEGARIVVADLLQEEGVAVRDEIKRAGGEATFVTCDVSDAEQVEHAVRSAMDVYGCLDTVFANAGINGVWAPVDELRPEEWDRTIAVNLRSTYLAVHYAVPHLRRVGGGSIIITSSVNGNRSFSLPGASAYSTSKAGQVAFMKMAAFELARDNIRVNAVCPGYIRTNISDRTEHRDIERVSVPMSFPKGQPFLHGGAGNPEDVGDVCVFLASDLSRHVTGVEIYVDGGSSLLR